MIPPLQFEINYKFGIKRIVHELKIFRFLKIPSSKYYYKNHDYLPLNRISKVRMKKGPARHTRTPPSSLPEPNIILLLYFFKERKFFYISH